jgi:hypothetical protein
MNMTETLFLLVCTLLVYAGIKIIYRLFFSPLAGFPGPVLAAATSFYEIYFDVVKGGQLIWEIERLHSKYGPVVRINPSEVHIRDPDFYDTLYVGKSRKRDKLPWFVYIGLPGSTFSTAQYSTHRKRRNILSPFFTKSAISDLGPVVSSKMSMVCYHLSKKVGTGDTLELQSLFACFAADTLSTYIFGSAQSFGYLESPDITDDWKRKINSVFEMLVLVRHFPWLLP